ncbi:suppressor of fused domain protein [Massilia atriviolacea]|uniref:Uncharacterized protein n=1 Tax=Massilia atriviolacea TaxID=2495579 RepID=A0A430HCI6_9BURK|nr:suppressor of fused domain protein [Massilia atriviolacea]RSZ55209.1 hypothetical protein EJB06_30575 [Massilia atriviolacea]
MTGMDNALDADVYRTIVLGHYIQYWGLPDKRRIVRDGAGAPLFEAYAFPAQGAGRPFRIASVGLAHTIKADGERDGREYYMALEDGLGGATLEQVFDYAAAAAMQIAAGAERPELPHALKPAVAAPAAWSSTALLLDQPSAENEGFDTLCIACRFDLEIVWLIPLHEAEYRFIAEHGIDDFDELVQASDQSLIDPARAGLVV